MQPWPAAMSPDCIQVPFVVDRLRELETVEYPGFTDATSIQEALDTLHMKDNVCLLVTEMNSFSCALR